MGKSNAGTKLASRPDNRIGVLYRASNPAHMEAVSAAARSLGLPVSVLIEDALNSLLARRGLKPLPPRTQK